MLPLLTDVCLTVRVFSAVFFLRLFSQKCVPSVCCHMRAPMHVLSYVCLHVLSKVCLHARALELVRVHLVVAGVLLDVCSCACLFMLCCYMCAPLLFWHDTTSEHLLLLLP